MIQFITQNDLEDQFSPLTIRSDFVVKLFKSFEGSNFNVDPNLPWNSQSPQVKKVSEARYKVITMLSEQMNTTNSNIQTQNTLSERQNLDKTEQLIMHFNIQGKRLLFIQQIKQQVKKITGPQLEEVYNDKTRLDEEGKEYTISIPSGSTEINTDLSPIQGSYWFGLELPIKKFIALAESSLEQAKKYSNQEAANLIEVTSNNISQE